MNRMNNLRGCLALLVALSASGCAQQPSHANSSHSAEATSGEISQVEVLKAKVEDVDASRRVIAMKDGSGRPFIIDVGQSVALESIRRDDWVEVKYQESVAFALKEPGELVPPSIEQSTRRVPDGVEFGRKIDAMVEVVSVTADGSRATFKVPEGMVRTVYVDDLPNQRKIARLRPGDEVAVTYTERLAVALDSSQ
jgi:ribosome-associated protein YbcJ (S4-like RNA binding protein)